MNCITGISSLRFLPFSSVSLSFSFCSLNQFQQHILYLYSFLLHSSLTSHPLLLSGNAPFPVNSSFCFLQFPLVCCFHFLFITFNCILYHWQIFFYFLVSFNLFFLSVPFHFYFNNVSSFIISFFLSQLLKSPFNLLRRCACWLLPTATSGSRWTQALVNYANTHTELIFS